MRSRAPEVMGVYCRTQSSRWLGLAAQPGPAAQSRPPSQQGTSPSGFFTWCTLLESLSFFPCSHSRSVSLASLSPGLGSGFPSPASWLGKSQLFEVGTWLWAGQFPLKGDVESAGIGLQRHGPEPHQGHHADGVVPIGRPEQAVGASTS